MNRQLFLTSVFTGNSLASIGLTPKMYYTTVIAFPKLMRFIIII